MNNLLLCFSSFHVESDPHNKREEEYAICYEQLFRVLPKNFKCVLLDNTINHPNDLFSDRLKSCLKNIPLLCYNKNIGKTNKGLGELDMLIHAKKKLEFSSYETVSYLTGRRIITCPYVFDKVNEMKNNSLMSNPPIYSVKTGLPYPMGVKLYNDMFFSMKTNIMISYCNYAENIIQSQITSLGSEQILFNFINENQISYDWIEHLGFLRNDWELTNHKGYTREEGNAQWI